MKMTNSYSQRKAKKKKHKEKLQKEALKRFQNLSEEENKKRRRKTQEIYQNLSTLT